MVFKNQRLSGEHHFVELKFNPQNMWFYWFSGSNACSSCESGKKNKASQSGSGDAIASISWFLNAMQAFFVTMDVLICYSNC